jgi:RecD/TraA family predicted helicase
MKAEVAKPTEVYPDSLKSREKFLAVSDWRDSVSSMIRSGFLSEEDCKALTALARDGSSPCRMTRRANALVLLDEGWSCQQVAHALLLDDDTRDATDFYFVEASGPDIAVTRLIELVKERIPRRFGFDPMRDIQVLCPMNRGGLGARSLNIELQRALNPRGEPKVEKFGTAFAIGDKVMQIENDYDKEVYNGDIGYVEAIDLELGEITITFDGRPVAYAFGELDQIVLAYATTIHKSQGSEYPAVVIPVTTQHYMMLQRNLLYTGITRGKRLVILLGQKKAVAIAVKNVSGRRRWSKLREWLNPVSLRLV